MHATSDDEHGGQTGHGEGDQGFPARLHLCHDTVTLSAEGSFAVWPQAAAYTHGLEKTKVTIPEIEAENERRAAKEREEEALKLERSLRSQDPLDYVKAGSDATNESLRRMAAGVTDLMALKDALMASKALPVTVLLPLTLACSKLLRTQELHKLAIEELLTQVKHMSPPSLLEERDALLTKLDKAEEEIEFLRFQEESRLLALKIHRREMVSQKWNQLSVKLKAAQQRMHFRIVTTRLKARNSKLNHRLENLVEGNRLRTKAGGALKLIRDNVGMLVQPRSPSPGVSDDEGDIRHRRAPHGSAGVHKAVRPSTSPVFSSMPLDIAGDSRTIQDSVEVHRANTPRQTSTALVTEVDRKLMAGVSFDCFQRRPNTSPVTGHTQAVDSSGPSTVRSQRTAEATAFDRQDLDSTTPVVGPAPNPLGPSSDENMLFINTCSVSGRGGPRRSRGVRYRLSSKTSNELAEAHGVEHAVPRIATDENTKEKTISEAEALPFEDSYVLDSAREMAPPPSAPIVKVRRDSSTDGACPTPSTLVPPLNLQAVQLSDQTPGNDSLSVASTSDRNSNLQLQHGSSSDYSTPALLGQPPRRHSADRLDQPERRDKEQPYRDDQRPSTAYEGSSLEGTGTSLEGTEVEWPPSFTSLDGTHVDGEARPGTAAASTCHAGVRPGTAPAAPETDSFTARFDQESVPRSEVMELKLRHSLQLRTVQRAFEERLQILTKFWQQKGVDMLDRKVCDVGVGLDPPPPGLRPPPTAAQIASRAKAAGEAVAHQLSVAEKGVIKTGSPASNGNPPVPSEKPRVSEFINSRGRPVPNWQMHAQSSRPSQTHSPREFRILPGGYHAFVYPPRKELVSRDESRGELRSHSVVSHDKQNKVMPFNLSEKKNSVKRFGSRHSSCPIGSSPRSQTAPAGATRTEQALRQR